jgi:signal transduction histidine kinase
VRYYEYRPARYTLQDRVAFEANRANLSTRKTGNLRARISELEEDAANLKRFRESAIKNAAQIQQAAMNLITNASEALGENEGVISVTVADARLKQNSPATDALNLAGHNYLRLLVPTPAVG